jgi:isopentenyl-diphosphate delta-isomerase
VENVILVDEQDNALGLMEKMEAHEKGLLHRAFSVFILNDQKQILLQQRAHSKYHSGGLWTNTCCSHPRDGETNLEAAHRRLQEEMGFDCPVEKILDFVYRAELDHGLTEHEFDHVFIGTYNDDPVINPEEVASFKWMDLEELKDDIKNHPEIYTEWFKIIFDRYYKHVTSL